MSGRAPTSNSKNKNATNVTYNNQPVDTNGNPTDWNNPGCQTRQTYYNNLPKNIFTGNTTTNSDVFAIKRSLYYKHDWAAKKSEIAHLLTQYGGYEKLVANYTYIPASGEPLNKINIFSGEDTGDHDPFGTSYEIYQNNWTHLKKLYSKPNQLTTSVAQASNVASAAFHQTLEGSSSASHNTSRNTNCFFMPMSSTGPKPTTSFEVSNKMSIEYILGEDKNIDSMDLDNFQPR